MGRRLGPYPHDFRSLHAWLQKAREPNRAYRVLPGKRCTAAECKELFDGTCCIDIRYQHTAVLTLFADGSIQLNSGGYRTATTKARMCEWLPTPYAVGQHRGAWHLHMGWLHREGRRDVHLKVPFEDHMIVQPSDGTVRYFNGLTIWRDALLLKYKDLPDDFCELEFETSAGVPDAFMRFASRLEVD